MKSWQSWTCGAALCVCMALLTHCSSCSYINKKIGLENDNIIESHVEELLDEYIEDQTGVDPNIDLTP